MRKIDQLYTCLRYCEDVFECRRTLQLRFFGEHFNKSLCNKTCDNCREGREAEDRNLTAVAREILGLLSCLETQKNGRGITLVSLAELWRGTKAKNHTKFLQLSNLTGYGGGKNYSKHEVDTITHAMVFENILEEISSDTGSGFAADYVQRGPKAQGVLGNSYQFRVRFPVKKAPEPKEKASKKKDASDGDKKPKAKKKGKRKKDDGTDKSVVDQQDSPDSIASDEMTEGCVLPKKATIDLTARIKKLIGMWAEEEQMNGKNVFYWNILSTSQMKNVAGNVPTTLEELAECDIPQEVQRQYGERIIRSINAFVESQNLKKYLENRPKKKQKTDAVELRPAVKSDFIDISHDDDADEFGGDDIDFAAVQMPPAQKAGSTNNNSKAAPGKKPNPYHSKPIFSQEIATKPKGKLKSKKQSSYFG